MTNTLAIIAAGAMAARSHDAWPRMARVLTSLKGRSQATVDRAHQAGMISASDEEIAAHAELVLSVVPPGEALALAERLQPVFARQSRGPIFMDCNAVNPTTLDRIRAAIGQDEHFLDTCIIGSPPKLGGPSPTPLTAYAPLAQGRAANDPTLATIGRKHGATAAQVAIAWLLDQESVIAIPKAGRKARRQISTRSASPWTTKIAPRLRPCRKTSASSGHHLRRNGMPSRERLRAREEHSHFGAHTLARTNPE